VAVVATVAVGEDVDEADEVLDVILVRKNGSQ